MPGSKRNISKEKIELEIYKTFERFKKSKNIEIADFLKTFDVSVIERKKYRKIKFSYESLIKLVLFQKLKGIKFQTQLVKYLKRHPKERYKLGFTETPDQSNISRFINHTLDRRTKESLDFAAAKIEEISEKFGILLDVKTLEPEKPKKAIQERNQYILKDKKTREICKLFKRRFTPFINLHMGKNCVYKKTSFIEFLIHLGLNQNFAESGSKIFKEFKGICPDADTLLYHLKKYSDTREIQRLYERLFEIIWDITKQSNAFDIRKRVDLAVDFTEWLYYGNRRAPMVLGKMPERGTDKCYKFITINIVDSGKRFTLLALPVSNFDTKEVLLNKLIYYAKKRVKINRVYLDRGFFDSKSINVLNSSGVRWLIPGTRNPLIKKTLEISPAPTVITGFNMKHVTFNLAIGYDENGVKRVMATNAQYNNNDVNFIDRLFMLYSKRWGIETSYRVKKHSFRAKTTSKNYYIRLFYFLFSVLMYNLWILCDILIWLHLFGFIGEDHKITSKVFGTILITIDPGG